jgi:hypothetical protein
VDWFSWAEYCYNTSFHIALRATPFEVVYGRPPPPILPYTVGSAKTEAADTLLRSRDEMLAEVRQRLLQAQQLSKKYYDTNHRDVELDVGAWVWLRLLHRTAQSLDPQARRKLGPRYAGPFQVLERVCKVAYLLQLPAGAQIHDVFHVGLLKPHRGSRPLRVGRCHHCSMAASFQSRRLMCVPSSGVGVWYVCIKWHGLADDDATWEQLEEFRGHYPHFQLEDELFAQAGRDVMTGRTFGWYPRWLGRAPT